MREENNLLAKIFLLGLVLPVVLLGSILTAGHRVRARYEELSTNSEIISAFNSGNLEIIRQTAVKHGLVFNTIESEKLVSPAGKILGIESSSTGTVLEVETGSTLPSLLPRMVLIDKHVYLFFVLGTSGENPKYYTVLSKVV